MMRELSAEEIMVMNERKHFLWTSDWLCDVLCAILIDSSIGNSGMEETAAHVKVSAIMAHLGLNPLTKTNKKWTTEKPRYI